MEKIKKEQLTGYRTPTTEEVKRIRRCLLEELAKESRRYRRTAIFLGTTAGVFFLALLYGIAGAGTFSGESLVMAVITLLMLWGCVGVNRTVKRGNMLAAYVQKGDFDVMECMSERFDTNVEKSGKGAVLIRDRNGKLCSDYFLIDYKTARQYRGNTCRKLLLMRQKECGYYRVFTEAMLDMEGKF